MTKILIGIHLAEAAIDEQQLQKPVADSVFRVKKSKLLQKLNITEKQFESSYRYYLKNPKYLEIIYGAVIDSLSLKEALILEKETR